DLGFNVIVPVGVFLMASRESLVDLLLRQVEIGPGRLAIIHGNQRISYGELWRKVFELSVVLQDSGVQRGTRVLLYLNNSVDYVAAYYALAYLSAVSVPLNTGLKGYQIADIMQH